MLRSLRAAAASPTLFLRNIDARIRRQFGIPRRWVRRDLLSHQLVVRDGTIRPEADYDDAWLHACCQHASRVFDVGANIGQSALLALTCPNIERVVLIEANWQALSVAAENLIRNQFAPRANFVGAFASDVGDAVVDFWTIGTGAAGSMFSGHAVSAARGQSVVRVPTVTLDQVAAKLGVDPDLVKIDVEGAEGKVLAGATSIARRQQTRFLVEMHSPPELPMAANAELVLEWARTTGYAAWYLSEATRLTSPDPIKHRGRCHLLLQPASWPYPEWLVGIKQSAPLPA